MTLSTIVRLLYVYKSNIKAFEAILHCCCAAAVQNLHWLVIICLTQFIQLTNYTFSERFLFHFRAPISILNMYNLLVDFTCLVCVYLQSNKCFLSTFYTIHVQFVSHILLFERKFFFLFFKVGSLGNTIVLLTITSISVFFFNRFSKH